MAVVTSVYYGPVESLALRQRLPVGNTAPFIEVRQGKSVEGRQDKNGHMMP